MSVSGDEIARLARQILRRRNLRTDFLDASSLSTEGTVIDDYAETAGATRQHASDVNHEQRSGP